MPSTSGGDAARAAAAKLSPAIWVAVWIAGAVQYIWGHLATMFEANRWMLENAAHKKWATSHDPRDFRKGPTCALLRRPMAEMLPHAYYIFRAASTVLVPLVAACAAAWLTQRHGRRASIFVGVLMMAAAQLVAGLFADIIAFSIAMCLHFGGLVIALQGTVLQVVEVAPAPRRGMLMALCGACQAVGQVTSTYLDFALTRTKWEWGFRLSLMLGMWPAIIILGVTPGVPESPASLLQRDRQYDARQVLQSLRGELADIQEEYDSAKAAVLKVQGLSTWRVLTERRRRPGLLIAACLAVLAAICGPGFLLAPSTHSFSTDEATTEEVYLFSYLLPAVMELAGAALALVLIDSRLGRRSLIAGTSALMGSFGAAAAVLLHAGSRHADSTTVRDAITVIYFLAHISKAAGWFAPVYVVAAEVLGLPERSAGVALYLGLLFSVRGVLEVALRSTPCSARAGVFGVQAVISFGAAAYVVLLVPETRGVPLERVTAECIGTHWFWRRFVAPPPQLALRSDSKTSNLAARV